MKILQAFVAANPKADLEEQIYHLHQQGQSKVACMFALNRVHRIGLGDAKSLVHFSPTFAYVRAPDEAFHDEIIQTLEELQENPLTQLRLRAVGILFNDQNEVLLMLRRKNGIAYATLPGGGIEEGETPAEACAREVLEEVNLVVEVGPEVLVLDNLNNHEHYFLTRLVSGEMRLGDGPEGTIRQSEENWYEPQWVSLERLEEVNLVPEQARELVRGLSDQNT